MLSQWYPPEPQKVVSDLAESLSEQGFQVTVLTGFPNYPTGSIYEGYRLRLFQREIMNGIPVIRVPLFPDHSASPLRRALNFLSFALCAAFLGPLLIPRVDLVYVIHPPLTAAFPAWIISRLQRVPFVYEIQDMWPETLRATGMVRSDRLLKLVGCVAKWTYKRAAAIRVISPGFRRNLIDKSVDPRKIHVISNWVDTEFYRPLKRSEELAQNLGLAGGFNVIYAGAMGRAQGLDTALDAAALLKQYSDLRFVMIGEGTERARLQDLAAARELHNVVFLGPYPAERMAEFLSLADVLLIHLQDDPLFRITVPHKTFTYLASQKPILAAISGDAASVVESAGAGLACPPSDAIAMAKRVEEFYSMDANQRQQMADAGRVAACSRYNRRLLTSDISDMLRSLDKPSLSLPRSLLPWKRAA